MPYCQWSEGDKNESDVERFPITMPRVAKPRQLQIFLLLATSLVPTLRLLQQHAWAYGESMGNAIKIVHLISDAEKDHTVIHVRTRTWQKTTCLKRLEG